MPVFYVRDGVVAELLPESDVPLAERYTAEFLAACHEGGDQVQPGWTFDGGKFAAPVPPAPSASPRYVPVPIARERLEAVGKWDALVGALATDMPKLIKLLTLQDGLDPNDPEVIGVLTAIGADPAAILAP